MEHYFGDYNSRNPAITKLDRLAKSKAKGTRPCKDVVATVAVEEIAIRMMNVGHGRSIVESGPVGLFLVATRHISLIQ